MKKSKMFRNSSCSVSEFQDKSEYVAIAFVVAEPSPEHPCPISFLASPSVVVLLCMQRQESNHRPSRILESLSGGSPAFGAAAVNMMLSGRTSVVVESDCWHS